MADYRHDEFGADADALLFSNVLKAPRSAARCWRARVRRCGGCVQGYFLSEDRRAPQFTTLHNLSALALWDGGRTVGDMQALIAAAGFERQTVLRQESSGFFCCCRPRSCDAVPIPNHGANMSTLTLNNTESEVIAWLKENRNATVEGIKEKN